MSRAIHNPFKHVEAETKPEMATASASEDNADLAIASALSNTRPDICPKCGSSMGLAYLYNKTAVHYCAPCRVTHPKE